MDKGSQTSTMKLLSCGLVVFLYVSLDNLLVASQQTNEPKEHLYVVYCEDDFQCSSKCEPYVQASDQCSCHPACKMFKDCCYDSDNYISTCSKNDDSDVLVSDVLPKYEPYFQCTTDVISNEKYWMVSKCPDSWNETNQCDSTNSNSTVTVGKLEDNLLGVPVVSPDGVTFRNIYCAICHGENPLNLVLWSFEANECVDTDMFETSSNISVKDKVRYLIDNCEQVSFLPPSDSSQYFSTLIPCRQVEDHVINVCEDSVEDSAIVGNCSRIAAPLEANGNTFKNKFCLDCYFEGDVDFLCYEIGAFVPPNPPVIAPVPCIYNLETGEVICPTPEPPPPLVPISITFDFGGQTGGVSISKNDKEIESISITCEVGQVFDPLQSQCVHLACPDGYQLRDTLCVQTFNFSNNDTVSCPRFALNVTVGSKISDENFCSSSSLENALQCLPEETMFLLKENLKHNNVSCQTGKHSSELMFQTSTSSWDVINGILSIPGVEVNVSSQLSVVCSSIRFVEILAYCSYVQSNIALECGSEWLNRTQWLIQENSTDKIVIEDTQEIMSLSEVKIQSYFTFFSDNNISLSNGQVSIMRCSRGGMTTCPLITLNSSLFEPESNGSKILVYTKNETNKFTPDKYKLFPNGSIQVCNFLHSSGVVYYQFLPEYSIGESILSTTGITLSIVALSFTLVTYCLFSEMRSRLANILIMILCACLISAQLFLVFSGVATASSKLCAVVTGLGHFLWLAAFTTTSVLGFALNQTFSLRNQVKRGRKPSCKTVTVVSMVCFGPPSVISVTLVVLYFIDASRFGITYGSSSGCWIGGQTINLFFFGIPVAASLLVNLVFFLHVTVSICIQMRSSERVRKTRDGLKLREALIYIKIFVILGLTWTIGFAAAFTNLRVLWYIFTLLTSMQGVFIFLAFTLKSNVWKMWRKRLGLLTEDSSTQNTSSRTNTNCDKYSHKVSTSATAV